MSGRNSGPESRPAPSSERGVRTRDAILRAALQVFQREGFVRTTMSDIAREAGVASGTTYQYFTDKADVLRYILNTIEDRLYRETRMPEDADGRLVVRESVLRYLALYREYRAAYGAWWELLVPHTEFTDAWVDTHKSFRSDVERALRRGRRAKIIGIDVDPEVSAELWVAMFERLAYSRVVEELSDGVTDEDIASVVSALLGTGLASPDYRQIDAE
jgi:AcrR family transcriptional regulator